MTNSGQRFAVVDMGTNTFHLLAVEQTDGQFGFKQLVRERNFVNLAEHSIDAISSEAWQRGMHSMENFARLIEKYRITDVRAVGTAALRHASNSDEFIHTVVEKTGIRAEVIDGQQEADFIAKGVAMVTPPDRRNILIVDIGGGSVEFILRSDGEVAFCGSFPIGVAVLFDHFHKQEPISEQSLMAIDKRLNSILAPLHRALIHHPAAQLVGASGTFEVLDSALQHQLQNDHYAEFHRDDFTRLYHAVSKLTLSERLAHPLIPNTRARYIVVAMHLIDYIMRYLQNPVGGISQFAMKEGIVKDWLDNLD